MRTDITVRLLIGASAYACIKSPECELDVRLEPGRGAAQSLQETAREYRERAARLIARADLMDCAADVLTFGHDGEG